MNSIVFEKSNCSTKEKLRNFSKYVKRQDVARFLAMNEIFKRQIDIKGSIIECGVHHGGGLMTWAHLSATYEPYNFHRHIIGFDTFQGFPAVDREDGASESAKVGMFSVDYDVKKELSASIEAYDQNRFLNHKQKVFLVPGDANITIPKYLNENQHLLVSLLYLDFDIYKPTVTALKTILPRMSRGSIIAFDEINNPGWPGETQAMLEELDISKYKIECMPFEPNISFLQL